MGKLKRALFILGLGFSFYTSSTIVQAQPVVEQIDRLQLDWGNLKLRFVGNYRNEKGELSYLEIEKHAVSDGIVGVQESIVKIHQEELSRQGVPKELAERSAVMAAEAVTRNTYSYQTSFFKDGTVRVFLESNLTQALARKDAIFRKASDEKRKDPRFSGLILRVDKSIRPMASYEVVDSSGNLLFNEKAVVREAYEKNLMGRWFTDLQRDELDRYIGPKPVSITVRVDAKNPNRFLVERGPWTDALQDSDALLSEARIALVVPK